MRKRIVLIGPVYPYKGGISHYTGLLYRTLSKESEVILVSYKVQYPKILFKREQKDYSNQTFKIDDTQYLINTANPINWIISAKKIKKLHPDLVIFQWWHPYFSPCYWTICKMLKHIKIMFTCHNVFPHERFPADRFLTRRVLSKGDGFIVHSIQDEEDLHSIKKEAICTRTVHPTYNAFKINQLSKGKSRKILNIKDNEKVLLFFGFVREYKGLKYLIEAIPTVIEKIPDIKLLVVGEFAGDKDKYLDIMQREKVEEYIQIYDGYIPDQEVEKFFAASDIVVLPYISATQSGIVQIAYGFEKPVVVTNVGGLPEVVKNGKTGYVVEAENSGAIAQAIIKFFESDNREAFESAIQKEADRYSWDSMSKKIYELMDKMK